jgi:hypothetical protein
MQKPVPPPQYWTAEAAQQLGLRYHDGMQDWPWEVAQTKNLAQYFRLYRQLDVHAAPARRIVVLELILEAASNGPLTDAELRAVWPQIKALLDHDAEALATTAEYWCVWLAQEANLDEEAFRLSPFLREWWRANYPPPPPTASE